MECKASACEGREAESWEKGTRSSSLGKRMQPAAGCWETHAGKLCSRHHLSALAQLAVHWLCARIAKTAACADPE